jgi:hypothetical protein
MAKPQFTPLICPACSRFFHTLAGRFFFRRSKLMWGKSFTLLQSLFYIGDESKTPLQNGLSDHNCSNHLFAVYQLVRLINKRNAFAGTEEKRKVRS